MQIKLRYRLFELVELKFFIIFPFFQTLLVRFRYWPRKQVEGLNNDFRGFI